MSLRAGTLAPPGTSRRQQIGCPMQQVLFDFPALPVPARAHGATSATPDAAARQRWWRLQGRARRAGRQVEPVLVTPRLLARIGAPCCPVTREPLGRLGAEVVALRDDADYAAGHLVTLGAVAAAAVEGRSWAQAWATADRLAGQAGARDAGLDAAQWRRLAVLRSFVQPLTPAQVAALPLLALPPARLRVLSAVQGLQVAVTLALAAPRRAKALCRLAALGGNEDTRQALRLFVLTLLARCPAELAARDASVQRQALEDLWSDELLARRWLRLAQRLSDAAADRLLGCAQREGLLGSGWRVLESALAVDGWALADAATPAACALSPRRP